MAVLITLAGALAQFVDGLLGMGYGVSASTLLMALGVAPAVISATVHVAELPSAAVSAVAHGRRGNIDRAIAIPLAAGGVAGGIFGALALSQFASGDVKPFVALVLGLLGARMLVCAIVGRTPDTGRTLSPRRLVAVGLVGGSLDAFGGGGWGPTCTSVLMTGDGREPRRLIGSVNCAEVATTAAIVVTLAFRLGAEPFVWTTALPLLVGGMVAAPFAARICSRVSPRVLQAGVGTTLVALNASIIAGALGADAIRPILWSVSAAAAIGVSAYALFQHRFNTMEA